MKLFIQGENIKGVHFTEVEDKIKVKDIIEKAHELGFPEHEKKEHVWIGLEDNVEGLDNDDNLTEDKHGKDVRIHCHRCKKVQVICTYNGETKTDDFPPSKTFHAVKHWVTGPKGFNIPSIDAAELELEISTTKARPSSDEHIGSFVNYPECHLSLDLVPVDRNQGASK